MKRLKVCHLLSTLEVGGMENGVVNLCNGLDPERFETTVYCLKGEGAMRRRLGRQVRVLSFDFPEGRHPLRCLTVAAALARAGIDILHTHGWGGGLLDGYLAGRLVRVPRVVNGEHGSFFLSPRQVQLQKLLLKRFDALLAVSEVLRQRVAANFSLPPERLEVIHNGVDTDRFRSDRSRSSSLLKLKQEGYQVCCEDLVIGNVGSLRPVKNQILLLRALAQLNKRWGVKAVLFLVGEGPDRGMLEAACQELEISERVFFLGHRDDLPNLYGAFDLLVQCSHAEGMSNVILEAMASGTAVICTRGCDEKSELLQQGVNGFFVEDSPEELCRRMAACSDPALRDRLAGNAAAFIRENFSVQCMVGRYAAFYERLMA